MQNSAPAPNLPLTRDEALIEMTMRWLEAERRAQAVAGAPAQLDVVITADALQRLKGYVLERTPDDLKETFNRAFAECLGGRFTALRSKT